MSALIIWWLQPYFSGLKLINPVFIHLGSWQIHWYGVLMAGAVVLGWRWLEREAKGTVLAPLVSDLVIWVTLGGILGARILFVLLKWPEFAGHWMEIFYLAQGGLSIHGAILGGALAAFIYCRRYQLPVWRVLDLLVIPLVMGQIIGRLGNFFNQEAFGGPTSLPWKMWVAPISRPTGWENYSFFHPTFLYEMIGLGLMLWFLQLVLKRNRPDGSLAIVYLMSYSLLRFGIEFFRLDSDKWSWLTVAQWGSLLIIMGAVILGLILKRSQKQ